MNIEQDYLLRVLNDLLQIPSPSGYTDQVVRFVCSELDNLGVPYELTRRGAIRALLKGKVAQPRKAIVAHLDTLGAMVTRLKANGRLEITPIGHWSSRFAEGARVTIFSSKGPRRGSILPLRASGHVYNEGIDEQPVSWEQVELRVDEKVNSAEDLKEIGFNVGDFVAIDAQPEFTKSGFINSRHLDNKAGVSALLNSARVVVNEGKELAVDCYLLFTISEEVGSGASAVLHGDVAEMVSIDNSTLAEGQNSSEFGVTIAMKDSTGPFDYHLTQKLIALCEDNDIEFARDVFKYYRCDAASAIEAGNDIRTGLVCFACDASHGYERSHLDSLEALSNLLCKYMKAEPTSPRDKSLLSPRAIFPTQPQVDPPEPDLRETLRPDKYKKNKD